MKLKEPWMEGTSSVPSSQEGEQVGDPNENKVWQLERQVQEQKNIIQSLYTIVVRSMVVLKNLLRIGALIGCWYFFGPVQTYWLGGFIIVVGLVQLTIDKTRRAVNPKSKLSEWNFID